MEEWKSNKEVLECNIANLKRLVARHEKASDENMAKYNEAKAAYEEEHTSNEMAKQHLKNEERWHADDLDRERRKIEQLEKQLKDTRKENERLKEELVDECKIFKELQKRAGDILAKKEESEQELKKMEAMYDAAQDTILKLNIQSGMRPSFSQMMPTSYGMTGSVMPISYGSMPNITSGAMSGSAMSGGPMSGSVMPGGAMFGGPMSGSVMPGGPMFGSVMPGGAMSGGAMFGGPMSGLSPAGGMTQQGVPRY
jgi:hypothetical protein